MWLASNCSSRARRPHIDRKLFAFHLNPSRAKQFTQAIGIGAVPTRQRHSDDSDDDDDDGDDGDIGMSDDGRLAWHTSAMQRHTR